MAVRRTLIITDKCVIGLVGDDVLTLKDIVERLNTGELHLEAIRYTSGPNNERHWQTVHGTPLGRKGAILWAGPHIRKLVVEKGQSYMRNQIFTNLQKWKDAAIGKPLTVSVHVHKNMKAKPEPTYKERVISEIEKYMDGLKDTCEIGALYKFMRHIKKMKEGE